MCLWGAGIGGGCTLLLPEMVMIFLVIVLSSSTCYTETP